MGEVIGLFDRTRSAGARAVSANRAVGDGDSGPAEIARVASDADRAQAALFAELLAEHRSRITLALAEGVSEDPGRTRLDRAALRQELREVADHLETIDRRST